MADVSIKYKGSTIAEMSGTGTKTLNTGGTYCDGDISVSYAPRSKTYEITLAKASGWILLTTLDAEMLAHINDETLVVSLVNISPYAFENYSGSMYFACNIPKGYNGVYPVYGLNNRMQTETIISNAPCYYPANNTGTNTNLGGYGTFRVSGEKYYLQPGDGFIAAGTYRLTFTW